MAVTFHIGARRRGMTSDSNGAISFAGKAIKVSLPYKLQDGEKASNVKVFFINENNQAVEVDAEYEIPPK